MADLLVIDRLTAGYGEAVVLSDVGFASPTASRWRCSAATASARRR